MAQAALQVAAAQHKVVVEDNEALVAKAMQAAMTHTLLMLGLSRPAHAILFAVDMAAGSTCSSAVPPPHGQLLSFSTTPQMVGIHPAHENVVTRFSHVAGWQRDHAGGHPAPRGRHRPQHHAGVQ